MSTRVRSAEVGIGSSIVWQAGRQFGQGKATKKWGFIGAAREGRAVIGVGGAQRVLLLRIAHSSRGLGMAWETNQPGNCALVRWLKWDGDENGKHLTWKTLGTGGRGASQEGLKCTVCWS